MTEAAGRKTGRRPGATDSRDALLHSARANFTQHGFAGATLRGIAADAGADPALIRHFFGGKQGLFVAAMELPTDVARTMLSVFESPRDNWGRELTRTYLTLWEAPASSGPLRATIASAFTNEKALEVFRDFFARTLLAEASTHLPPDNPELRISLAMSQLMGLALTRNILGAPHLRHASIDELTTLVGPTVQRYLTGELPANPPAHM